MSLFNPIEEQFIARPDNSKDQIIYKYPDNNIRMLSVLTVQPDEICLFIKQGVVAGIIEQGQHRLDGANIPFLGGLIDTVTGGNVLISDVYFISIREFPNFNFGGFLDNVVDPQTTLAIGLRVFGEFALKVNDSTKLILNFVGTQNLLSNDEISNWSSDQLLKATREIISNHITNDKWDILGIASKIDDLSSEIISQTKEYLLNYGIEITQLGNLTVTLKPEDETTLKEMRRNIAYNNTPNLADTAVKMGAATGLENSSGNASIAGAGIAAGIGFGMMNNMMNQNSQSQQAQMIICKNCQTENLSTAKFCSNCGTNLV
jgi:membrane protease subunit (stomatin/prohibitin family)